MQRLHVMQRPRNAARLAWLIGAIGMLVPVHAAVAQTPVDLATRSMSTIAADHRALAAHYRAHAAEHDADATAHEALVVTARTRSTDDDAWDLARDAAHYAEHSHEAAEALRDLAQLHEAIADRLAPGTGTATDSQPDAKGCCRTHKADMAKPADGPPAHDHAAK